MKKILFNLVALIFIIVFGNNALHAQTKMSKGDNLLQTGVGIGGWTTDYTTSQTPLMILTYEKGIKDGLGQGNLSIGGTFILKSGEYVGDFYAWTYTYTALAARASYHPYFIKSEKWDAYGGLSLGVYSVSTKVSDGELVAGVDGSAMAWGLHLGARYELSERWGAWAELGAGVGNVGVGIAYQF